MYKSIFRKSSLFLILLMVGSFFIITSCDLVDEAADAVKDATTSDVTAKCEGDVTLGDYSFSFCDNYSKETVVTAKTDCETSINTTFTADTGCGDTSAAVAKCTVVAETGVEFVKYFFMKTGKIESSKYAATKTALQSACEDNPLYDTSKFEMIVAE